MSNKLNIVLSIHHSLSQNFGAPGVTLRLAYEYASMGHQVRIVSYDDLPDYFPSGPWRGILYPFFLALYLMRLQRREEIDIVDASTGDAWVWSLFRRRDTHPFLISRSHGLEHRYHDELTREKNRLNVKTNIKHQIHSRYVLYTVALALQNSDLSLFLNQEDVDYVTSRLNVPAEKTAVVQNGIPDAFLGRPAPSPVNEDTLVRIAFIGSYHPRKGIGYAIEALQQVLRKYQVVEVTFLGTGVSEQNVLGDFATDLHSRIRVIPRYQNEKLPELLQGHHIKLLPSLCEGFGIVLIEAMACGLAPVTSNSQGPAEIVEDGRNGVLIDPRDVDAIVTALDTLITERHVLNRLRKEAHCSAQKYSWHAVSRDNIALYKQLLEAPASP